MRLLAVGALVAGALALQPVPAAAEPKVTETTNFYDLTGTTAEAVRADVRNKGPLGQNNRRFVGLTYTYVRYRFWYDGDTEACRVTNVTTEVDVTFTMPRWVDRDKAPSELQAKWDRFIAALWVHERGHRDIGVSVARDIEEQISNLGRPGKCGTEFRDFIQGLAKVYLDEIQPRHDKYDRDTGHGRTQGAGLILE
jgi:predicted secreted Zn-dependent protease